MNPSEQEALRWLNYWMQWLNQYEPSSLSDSASLLIEDLKRKYQGREISEALDLLERLQAFGEKANANEFAEIRLWSSLALAEMNLFKDALIAARDSVRVYKWQHKLSVASWMKGCIQWVVPGQQMDAIGSWQDSIKLFEALRYSRRGDVSKYQWYDERCSEMQKALQTAARQYRIPPLVLESPGTGIRETEIPSAPENDLSTTKIPWPTDNDVLETAIPQSSEDQVPKNDTDNKPLTEDNTEIPDSDWLELFSVYEHIKAGDFGPISILINPVGNLEIDRVTINGCHYWIQSVNGTRFVRAFPSSEFTVIRVSGDSMDKAGILDGDYVLLRLLPKNISDFDYTGMNAEDIDYYADAGRSNILKDGDIVAAEIFNEDNEIILKRIYRRGKKVILVPDSTDPQYHEREFDGMNQGFVITGAVKAVFKPL